MQEAFSKEVPMKANQQRNLLAQGQDSACPQPVPASVASLRVYVPRPLRVFHTRTPRRFPTQHVCAYDGRDRGIGATASKRVALRAQTVVRRVPYAFIHPTTCLVGAVYEPVCSRCSTLRIGRAVSANRRATARYGGPPGPAKRMRRVQCTCHHKPHAAQHSP